mmetsp:Transcript_37002/g.115192  ORF Transcript_37002/g.115192 Transcript_37002/m.115192 type:complete len:277 (-) Transcript_37002:102-932(-)
MRPHWWLAGAVGVGLSAVIVGTLCYDHDVWQHFLMGALAPGSPTRRSGLVREEDVHGPLVPEDEEEEAALLARVPRGSAGSLRTMVRTASARFSRLLRLDELQFQRAQFVMAHGPDGMGGGKRPDTPKEKLRGIVLNLLLVSAVFLKILGGLLIVMAPIAAARTAGDRVPISLVAYGLLSLPAPFMLQIGAISWCLERLLDSVEWLALPVLLGATRALGISRREALGEDLDELEVIKRTKRVLLGLLILNIASSFMAVVMLANLVIMVRLSGVFSQ